jgi:hypothetical protein
MHPSLRQDQPGTLALIEEASRRIAQALSKVGELRATIRESQETLAATKASLRSQPDRQRARSAETCSL